MFQNVKFVTFPLYGFIITNLKYYMKQKHLNNRENTKRIQTFVDIGKFRIEYIK